MNYETVARLVDLAMTMKFAGVSKKSVERKQTNFHGQWKTIKWSAFPRKEQTPAPKTSHQILDVRKTDKPYS